MKGVLDVKAGSGYDDDLASRYHFPSRYLKDMERLVGDWVVLRRPRDGSGEIAYFATATVQSIEVDRSRDGHYYANLGHFLPFERETPWRVSGRYFEEQLRQIEDISTVGLYLRGRSVRLLEDEDFAAIATAGFRPLFLPDRRRAIWEGDPPPDFETVITTNPRKVVALLTNRRVRDAAFRSKILEAYGERCAFTGVRMVNGGGRAEAQAAHIIPVARDGPDIVSNGLALSSTMHWLFDRHLLSVSSDYGLLIAHNRVPSELRPLFSPSQTRIHLPEDKSKWPSQRFLEDHRRRFAEAA